MIKVTYNDNQIKVTGHANFADYGHDIVCASVSSIIYTSVNGIMSINSSSIKFSDKSSILTVEIVNHDEITDKLIKNMLDLLNELSHQYPKNLKISKGE
jgi:uncharacterized protein